MQTDLFQYSPKGSSNSKKTSSAAPLAHRLRPQSLGEFEGQGKVLAKDAPLMQWIQQDTIPSLIFWGPPGCGKTTLAKIIANQTQAKFVSLSAVLSGVKDIKKTVEEAKMLHSLHERKTIAFIDEIHRFNKAQQDALLPHVENGTITLIGATTENPSFEINNALLSRVRVIALQRLNEEALIKILKRAAHVLDVVLSQDALEWLATFSDGDARNAITTLENLAPLLYSAESKNEISKEALIEALKRSGDSKPIAYDKAGEEHYNLISAFIKSIRDSDPDAGLYYLARMIEGGEDPVFIARRLVILASEDIGNADPRAISVAVAVMQAVQWIGMPECRINLAQAVTYLASAPKSNASYKGINEAQKLVRETGALPTPLHLRNGVTGLMKEQGYGKGYVYAHNVEGKIDQEHLPERLKGLRLYFPKDSGLEAKLRERFPPQQSDS